MAVKGKIKPIKNKVLVHNMNFGEQRTASGIFILKDDGKTVGIHPRWAQVFAVGPDHNEEYTVGDWVLVEHGRWTRGIEIDQDQSSTVTIRMIDTEAVMMWDKEPPNDVQIGSGI